MNEYFLHEILGGEVEAVEEKVGVKYAGLEGERRGGSMVVIIVDFL
jgi:hypothetical protein